MEGLKKFSPFGALLFTLSLVYLGAEIVFNKSLLDVASNVNSGPAEIDRIQNFGRSVSACGFSLLMLGLFSGSGFFLNRKRDWALFLAAGLVCLVPLALIMGQSVFGAGYGGVYDLQEMVLGFLPLLGVFFTVVSGGRSRVYLIFSLLLITWPAMYLGQKVLVEKIVIEKSGWQERLDAHYILMARSGLESCAGSFDDLQFCDSSAGRADMKAFRIVMGALWMISPEALMRGLENNRDALIRDAALRGFWGSPAEQYGYYMRKAAETRAQFEKEFLDRYYAPYKKASDSYLLAADATALDAASRQAADEVEGHIDEGWKKYRAAVRDYKQTLLAGSNYLLKDSTNFQGLRDAACARRECPEFDMSALIDRARGVAEVKFAAATGYPPDISDRRSFVEHKKTQQMIREEVSERMATESGLDGFSLPEDWRYQKESFAPFMARYFKQEADRLWRKKFGDKLSPGLDKKGFMDALGVDEIPPIEKMTMTEDEFFSNVVLPGNHKIVDRMLADIKRQRMLYASGGGDGDEGKDYVRALYLPVISLIISLTVVLLTMLRWLLAGCDAALSVAFRHGAADRRFALQRWQVRAAAAGVFTLAVIFVPYAFPNPYTAGAGYKKYLAAAASESSAAAHLLDWAVNMQPLVHGLGERVGRMEKYALPNKNPRR